MPQVYHVRSKNFEVILPLYFTTPRVKYRPTFCDHLVENAQYHPHFSFLQRQHPEQQAIQINTQHLSPWSRHAWIFIRFLSFADKRFRSLTLVDLRVNDERYETAVTGKLPQCEQQVRTHVRKWLLFWMDDVFRVLLINCVSAQSRTWPYVLQPHRRRLPA